MEIGQEWIINTPKLGHRKMSPNHNNSYTIIHKLPQHYKILHSDPIQHISKTIHIKIRNSHHHVILRDMVRGVMSVL